MKIDHSPHRTSPEVRLAIEEAIASCTIPDATSCVYNLGATLGVWFYRDPKGLAAKVYLPFPVTVWDEASECLIFQKEEEE